MPRSRLRVFATAAATAGSLGVLSCPAWAGSYVLSACSPSSSAGMWAQTNTLPAALEAGNLCGGPPMGPLDASDQGALYARDVLASPADIPDGALAGWTFTAPSAATITAIRYYRSLAAYNEPDLISGLFQGDGSALEQCKIPWPFVHGSSNSCWMPNNQAPVTFTGLNTSSLFLGVRCHIVDAHTACISGGTIHAARADLYSAKVTLSQTVEPTLSRVGGPLWEGGTVSGVVPVTYVASDPSGIQQQAVRSESGQNLVTAPSPCDFTLAPPCPEQPAGSLNVDTTRIADGRHSFSLVVIDAAGNSQVATSPAVTVSNSRLPLISPSTPAPQTAPRTKITAILRGRRLLVSGPIAVRGRVKVSWRSKGAHRRTLGHGSRSVHVHQHRLRATFTLRRGARRGHMHVVIRSGTRIIAHTRAQRS